MTTPDRPLFDSPGDEEAYFQAYERVMRLWPAPPETELVQTQYGKTHVCMCGPKDALPLVLLHGRNATSAMWFSNIEAWSQKYRCYAIDTMGEPGKSCWNGKPIHDRRDYTNWLVETLDQLNLQRAHFIGHSYGAWLALSFAASFPERVGRLALLEPAQSFSLFSVRFALWGIRLLLQPTRDKLEKFFAWEAQGRAPDPDWVNLMILGISQYPSAKEVIATIFTNDELNQFNLPVLLLLGGRSVVSSPKRAKQRALRYLPNARVEILPEASHNLPLDESARVNQLVMEFLQISA